jgi:hypothetical protein
MTVRLLTDLPVGSSAAPLRRSDHAALSCFRRRLNAKLSRRLKLICPVQSPAQKYFGFSETHIAAI